MKATRTKAGRGRRVRRRRFLLEALEPRVVLDAGLGAEVVAESAGFEQFESADELQQFLVDAAVDRWKDLFGTQTNWWMFSPLYNDRLEPAIRISSVEATASGSQMSGQAFDGTNIQVNGVDEADVVKTDGEYLYIANDGRLSIIDARNPSELSLAAELPLDSFTAELFVSGDRLVLLSNQYSIVPYDVSFVRDPWFPNAEFGPQTSVAIYDIADRTSPILIQNTTIDGNLTASRRIDDLVYLVATDQIRIPQLEVHCEPIAPDDPNVPAAEVGKATSPFVVRPPYWTEFPPETCIYETEQEYLARVADGLLELAMPSYETIDVNGDIVASGLISEPADTYKPLTNNASSVTSLVVIDLSTETSEFSASTSLITDSSSTVYASAQNIYVATNSYDQGNSTTTLQQFAVSDDGTTVDLAAVGHLPGWLLNQFAMDEHAGYLRVVTSTGWGADRTNQLFVLEKLGTSLDIVGSIDEIATGETVFAVRFVGDEAFVVTFRLVDPLFTIDLSDPMQPAIAGELKIPGFSNYLHPISEDFVLGLGRDEGNFWSSPQLSLFDASDLSLPTRVDKFVFENATWSEAFYNHHAISYFSDSQIAVIPFEGSFGSLGVCIDGIDFGVCSPEHLNAFWVIQIDTTPDGKSLQLLGKIEHDDALLRSLRIGENLFTVSAGTVKVTELLHPDTLIDELYFGTLTFADYVRVDSEDREVELDVLANDRVEDNAMIVEVSATATGAVVEISGDGKTLRYTPAATSGASTDNYDAFEYTAESGGRRNTTTVHVYIKRDSVRDRMITLANADLVNRLGPDVDRQQIRIGSVAEQQWPDSCLGVAHDGEVCAQVVTPGFKIVLEYALAEFVYHTDTTKRVVAVNDPVIDTTGLIQIRAEVVNAAGELVTSLLVGEQATLRIHADDLRDDSRGVFAAYFDVLFDGAQLAEIGPINHSSEFSNGKSGAIDEGGLIDEVGGFNDKADPNTTLVVSIPFTAVSSGALRFTTESADVLPVGDSLLRGLNSAVPPNRIRFGDVVVEVVESLYNEANPMDANMDGEVTPLDALVIINHLNLYGAGPVNAGVVLAFQTAAAEAHAVHFLADVNRDGFISPIDVLLIVNAIELNSELLGEGEAVAAQATSASSAPVAPVFVTTAAELRATSLAPAARLNDTMPAIELEDLFPAADAIDLVARIHTDHATPREIGSSEDTFFAELELAAANDCW